MEQNDPKGKGPWTEEEDIILRNTVFTHGENNWNSVAFNSGLRRCRSSCRLRWFNYLKPAVRRESITDEEMLRIIQLHSELGNRWSKISQQLPGRTDNEIKNLWYTRVKKEAMELNCEVGSMEFLKTMTKRLVERINAAGKKGGLLIDLPH